MELWREEGREGGSTITADKCDHACINQPLGAKVSERREIANAFTIIPIHFRYLIMPITLGFNQKTAESA